MLLLPGSQSLLHQVKSKMEATEVIASKDRDQAEEASEQERRKIPNKARKKAQNMAAKSSEVEKELEQKSWRLC